MSKSVNPVDVGEIPSPGLTIIPNWKPVFSPIDSKACTYDFGEYFWDCVSNFTYSVDEIIEDSNDYDNWASDFGTKIGVYFSMNQTFRLSTNIKTSYELRLKMLQVMYNGTEFEFFPDTMIYDKNYYLMNANPSTFPREVLKSGELMNVLSVLLVYLRLKKIRDGAKTSHISRYTVCSSDHKFGRRNLMDGLVVHPSISDLKLVKLLF